MERTEIAPAQLACLPVRDWRERWFLLAAGDFAAGTYNFMTVAWGGLGCMWERLLAMIVARPTRYTYEFLEKYPDFTLNLFPAAYAEGAGAGAPQDLLQRPAACAFPGRLHRG